MKFRYLFAVVLMCFFATSSSVFAGSESGGGGNGFAILVAREAAKLAQDLSRVPVGELHGVDPRQFEMAVSDTKIAMEHDLMLDGSPVDAINYPDAKRIVFSMIAIERLKGTAEFSTLVLHEYLGILKLNDLNYRISLPLAQYIAANALERSYRGGYESIECKLFVGGRQVAGEQSSAFHGVDLGNENGIDWNALFTSSFLRGSRRLFFRIEAIRSDTKQIVAELEIPADERIETTLSLADGNASMYCWVHYL